VAFGGQHQRKDWVLMNLIRRYVLTLTTVGLAATLLFVLVILPDLNEPLLTVAALITAIAALVGAVRRDVTRREAGPGETVHTN
jgi:putative flippase GtrA